MSIKPGYLLVAGGGIIFVWSGLKGKSATSVFRELIGGHDPGMAANSTPIVDYGTLGTGSGTAPAAGVTTAQNGNARLNQSLARMLAVAQGHPDWIVGQEWQDWLSLWNQESGWNQYADNASSGAYGIPQALPYTKMPVAAWPASGGGRSDPTTQMIWGIQYIAGRYESPSGAWAHEVANGWY